MEVSQWSSSDLPCGDCGCAPGCTANPGRRCPVRAYLCYICRRVLFYEFLSGAVRRCIYCGGTNLTRMAPPSSHRCVHPHPQAFLPSRHGNRRLCGSRPSGVHASIRYRVSHGPILVHVSTSVFQHLPSLSCILYTGCSVLPGCRHSCILGLSELSVTQSG